MSINNIANTVFPNTLSGLESLNVTNITINGFDVTTLFVPYTLANTNVDLNNKNLASVNNVGTTTLTATGLVQGGALTTTGLTTTNTLKVNSVPAGTTSKYLATDVAGNVIEANITTTYVPYTNATSHVNLNAKNISNVLTYSGTNVQVTSTETTSLLATGTTQLNTLRITNVQSGTQITLLAVDSAGNVINGTAPLPTAINVTATTGATTYYPSFIANTSGGSQTIYSDNTFQTISYETGTKTLTSYQLKLLNVPAGTQTSILAIDSAGNVIQGTTPPPTQLLTTAIPAGSISYYPTLISDRTTGNKSYFNQNALNTDNMYFQAPVLTTGLGTWYIPQLVINTAITLFNARFSTTPTVVLIGGVSYALGLNATNDVVAYVPSNQTAVTATTVNADFNLLFTATGISDPNITVNIDSGTNLKYNPATDTLTVPNLTVGTAATINGANLTGVPTAPTAAPGTNTTQIATTAFVIANSGSGFLPLTGGTMTGSITYANTALTPITLSSASLTAYTYSIRDSFWTLPMLEFTTKTLSTFGSVSIGVPIVITNTSATNLMSLPFNASTSYSKSISNTGGDLFITFTGRTTAPAVNGSVVFGNSIPVAINDTLAVNKTVGLYGVNGASNDGVTLWITSGGTACGSIVLSDTYGTTMGTVTPTTSWGRYFAVGGQVYQDFYGGFEWRGTNTLGATTWTTVATVAKLRVAQMGYRFGSMFDFSSAGGWDDSNSLFITTGGFGGNSSGVGIGYNTTFDSGLLVSIAPNVAWKPMRYKASTHDFYYQNTPVGGFNPFGIYINNAGVITNGSLAASISPPLAAGYTSTDLIFYASASQVMRFYTGSTCNIAMGSSQLYVDSIVSFTNPWAISVGGVNIWRDTSRLNLVVGTSVPTTGLGGNTNIIFGYECGRSITTGAQNVLMGVVGTGDYITSGNQNTLIGYQAGRIITTGSLNTAIGQQAMGGAGLNCTGNYNCGMGHYTLTTITSGSFNSALGVGAGTGLTTGYFCCYIGTNAQPSSAGVNNEVVICNTGAAVGKGGDTFFTQAGASYNGANSNVWNTISDRNIKKNIVPLTNELHKIMALRPVHFDYKETGIHGCSFIAQEWKEIFPELHTTAAPNEYQRKVLGLTKVEGILTDIVPHIVRGIQEQQEMIQEQKSQITKQQEQIDLLLKHVSLLTEQVNELTKQMKK
jgi:hypothetical protein